MRNFEAFTAQAIQKVTGNRLARGKADAVHKTVKVGPVGAEVGEQLVDLGVIAHVAVKDQFGVKVSGKLGDSFFKTFADIAESQLCALGVAGFGNAVGNRAVGQHARDQQFFACEKSHGFVFLYFCLLTSLPEGYPNRRVGAELSHEVFSRFVVFFACFGGLGRQRPGLGCAWLCAVGRFEIPERL